MRDIVCLTAFGRRAEWLGLACPYATILSPAQLFYMLEIDRSTRIKNLLILTTLLVVALVVLYLNSTPRLLNMFLSPSSLYEYVFKKTPRSARYPRRSYQLRKFPYFLKFLNLSMDYQN